MALQTVLKRLAANIFYEPYASDKKVAGVLRASKMSKSVGMTKPFIQINGPRRFVYLCYDIDREYGGVAWDDANMPPPNLIVVNPENLHAHLIYELAVPIWLRKGDDTRSGEAAPVRYLKAVQKALGRALGADTSYNGLMVKNPLHASWRVSSARERPYTLGELSEHLELDEDTDAVIWDNPEGRNCTLFDSCRFWAYRHLDNYSTYESFYSAVQHEIDTLNDSLPFPLACREVTHVAKSVASWVWNKYTGSGKVKRRGVMQLDPSESIQVRQQKGQAYTTQRVTDTNHDKVTKAILSLLEKDEVPTRAVVIELCGLHRNTVARYWAVASEEAVSLRDKSLSLRSGASPQQQADTLIPTGLCIPDVLTYGEFMDKHREERGRVIRAAIYAIEQARRGILLPDAPEKLKQRLLREVDMWRSMRTTDDKCITHRTT